MAHLTIKSAKLSASGQRKLNRLADLAKRGIAAMMEDLSEEIKEKIASFAPSEEEERYLLSLPGNDYDLFKREGGFLYLREAIITEEIEVKSIKNRVSAEFGNTKKINPLIGFAWYHGYGKYEKKELRTTTDAKAGDAWKNLLEMWEYGGQPFMVTPRDPGDALTIAKTADGYIVVDSVMKTIPGIQPFTMYQAGGYYSYNTLRKKTYERLKEVISWL